MVGKQTVEPLELSKGEIFEEWQHEILTSYAIPATCYKP